jgi:hypothetical protein
LVDRFHALMDELPEAYAARKIHPADLSESGIKLFDFLPGWLGGPRRYIELKSTDIPCCGAATCCLTPSAPKNATNGCRA